MDSKQEIEGAGMQRRGAAALGYGRAQHVIDLYIWPSSSRIDMPGESGNRTGYNFIRRTQDDMVFRVVSDLDKAELGKFVELWRTAS